MTKNMREKSKKCVLQKKSFNPKLLFFLSSSKVIDNKE